MIQQMKKQSKENADLDVLKLKMTLKNQSFSIKRHKVNVLETMGDIKLTKTKMLICEDNPTNLGNAWFSLAL